MDAAKLFNEHFSNLPDKSDAWQDLVSLAYDEEKSVRLIAAEALVSAFIHVPDKKKAGHDLHGLIQDEKSYREFREAYARALKEIFHLIPDKDEAWQDLHKLTKDDSLEVRLMAINAIGEFFSQIPSKDEAGQDLRRLLVKHEDFRELGIAARTIVKIFSDLPDKEQVWQDFVAMAKNWGGGRDARNTAARSLVSVFVHVPDKDQAWQDLIKIASASGAGGNQIIVAQELGSAFAYVLDKEQAWKDLVKLTGNEYIFARPYATEALGTAFIHIRDKQEDWAILHNLAYDKDNTVKSKIAYAIGSAFSCIPDKDEAWRDLVNLSQDKNNVVRMNAYHSLGRACIFKATAAKDYDTLESELVDAVNYFDRSSYQSENSPAKFCYPFYRSYYAITFQEANESEVQSYLADAKKAVSGSESKEELLLAVVNLAKALQEAQSQRERLLEDNVSDLNYYRWYCEKAAEYMAATEDNAPGAVEMMRKGNPLQDNLIQANNVEIQRKARQICQITRGSVAEFAAPGGEIDRAAAGLSGDLVIKKKSKSSIVKELKKFCMLLSEKENNQVCQDVEEIELEPDSDKQENLICRAMGNLYDCLERIPKTPIEPLVDVVVLTILLEEYKHVKAKLSNPRPLPCSGPNTYAWLFGEVFCSNHDSAYKVAVGMIGRAGDIQSALAAMDAIYQWRPKYLIVSGIAGGLPGSGLNKGDVIIANNIYGYEYGKIEEKFKPRANWTFNTDQGLLNSATAYSLNESWRDHIRAKPPEECRPKVVSGEIASGEKVIDDPSNEFFIQVKNYRPSIKAVDMEGAGIGSAIEHAQSQLSSVGFMVIRAISDLPRPEEEGDDVRGTEERDDWKPFASDVAAAFIMGWIADGLPMPPSAKNPSL